MKRLIIITILISLLVPSMFLYGASKDKEAEPERGKYLAGRGIIIPPEESRFLPTTKEPCPVPRNVIEAWILTPRNSYLTKLINFS